MVLAHHMYVAVSLAIDAALLPNVVLNLVIFILPWYFDN